MRYNRVMFFPARHPDSLVWEFAQAQAYMRRLAHENLPRACPPELRALWHKNVKRAQQSEAWLNAQRRLRQLERQLRTLQAAWPHMSVHTLQQVAWPLFLAHYAAHLRRHQQALGRGRQLLPLEGFQLAAAAALVDTLQAVMLMMLALRVAPPAKPRWCLTSPVRRYAAPSPAQRTTGAHIPLPLRI